MKLYHGTSMRYVHRILTKGLEPRGTKRGNWAHSVHSRRDCVYMTTAYAAYYAINTCADHGEDPVVLEIDVDRLSLSKLLPDEDFLEQATRRRMPAPMEYTFPVASFSASMKERTKWYREHLPQYNNLWELSVKHLGNCCYQDIIKPEFITRFATFDCTRQIEFAAQAMDPIIMLKNYELLGGKYRGMTKWLFGDDMAEDAPQHNGMFASWNVPKSRAGVTVLDTSKSSLSHPLLVRARRKKY